MLHLKEDAGEFLSESSLKELIHRYSEFITFPIYQLVETEEEVEVEDDEDEVEEDDEDAGEALSGEKQTFQQPAVESSFFGEADIWVRVRVYRTLVVRWVFTLTEGRWGSGDRSIPAHSRAAAVMLVIVSLI